MKSILIIGLGRFGQHLCRQMVERKNEVMVIDVKEDNVEAMMPLVTSAQIGDCTNEQYMSSLGIRNFDVCMVAIGDNFQSSLEVTSLLKDLGARFVVSRASRDIHAKFLLRNGADQVVYPEKETAIRAAVRYSSDNIFDFIELTQEHSIYEIPVPENWIGKTIIDVNVRKKYRFSILAVKYNEKLHPLPEPDYVFKEGDAMVILGENRDILRFVR